MLKHITLKLIATLLAIVVTSPAVAFGPGEAAGGRRPAPTIKAFPKGTDFVVLVWYRRDDPLGTFEHQFYDVRKGEYTRGLTTGSGSCVRNTPTISSWCGRST